MNKFAVGTVLAVLLFTTPAFAQMTRDSGPTTVLEIGYHQSEVLTTGRITEIDLAKGTMTLDTGMQFILSPALQYTSAPTLGEAVQVTYSKDGGQNVARIIEVGSTRSHHDTDNRMQMRRR